MVFDSEPQIIMPLPEKWAFLCEYGFGSMFGHVCPAVL